MIVHEPLVGPARVPDGGVIEDARARQRLLRRRGAVTALAGAAVAALIIGLTGGHDGAAGSHGHGAAKPVRITFDKSEFRAAGLPMTIAFTPGGYNGGGVAYFRYDGSFVVDDGAPGGGARVLVRWDAGPPDRDTPGRIMVAIVGHGVAAVRAGGVGTFAAQHVDGFPTGYAAVVFYDPHWPAAASVRNIFAWRRRDAELGRLVPLTPLDADGRPTAAPSTRN